MRFLKKACGYASNMDEFEPISMAHQENTSPEAIAHRLRKSTLLP
jgi:hypothetical protein